MHKITLNKFRKALSSGKYSNPANASLVLVKGLWVLMVSKDELNKPRLTAKEISDVILDVFEEKLKPMQITLSFNRSSKCTKASVSNGLTYFEILKPGREYLKKELKPADEKPDLNQLKDEVLFFEAGNKFTSKSKLRTDILPIIKGPAFIVDPYLGIRALDIVKVLGGSVQVLTRLQNLRPRDSAELEREIKDFKVENSNSYFRDYPHTTLHDRYIVSDDCLLILGTSLKDLGGKDSFVIKLSSVNFRPIIEAMKTRFAALWDTGIDIA